MSRKFILHDNDGEKLLKNWQKNVITIIKKLFFGSKITNLEFVFTTSFYIIFKEILKEIYMFGDKSTNSYHMERKKVA